MQTNKMLDRWDIRQGATAPRLPWGEGGRAEAQILGEADGYNVTVIEAPAGYTGAPHEHTHAEFFYLIQGQIRNQGQIMNAGDGYAAAAGSMHSDFEVLSPAKYLIVFRI